MTIPEVWILPRLSSVVILAIANLILASISPGPADVIRKSSAPQSLLMAGKPASETIRINGELIPVFFSRAAKDLAFTRSVLASKRTISVAGAFMMATGSGLIWRILWLNSPSAGSRLRSEVSESISK